MASLTLFLLVLLNPAVSWDVRPTPGVPALTSRAGASLSFALLTPPAASRPCARASPSSLLQCGSRMLRSSGFQSGRVCAFSGSWSQSALSRVPVRKSGLLPSAGGYCFLAPERAVSLPLLFSFRYLYADSRLPASYLDTQRWRCRFVEIQMYLPASQADSMDVQDGLVPIQLDSGDQLKKGSPTPLPS